jgi:translation initiation factor IF-1
MKITKKGASMQVSDLVRQYHNAAGQIQMTGTAGVKKLASSLREMGAGNVFEGTVNSVKNGQVVLGLSNGQTVNARLDGKVSLKVGQSMFFQVKSNDGTTIAIRPFTVDGSSANLTLMDALKAAKLPVDGGTSPWST